MDITFVKGYNMSFKNDFDNPVFYHWWLLQKDLKNKRLTDEYKYALEQDYLIWLEQRKVVINLSRRKRTIKNNFYSKLCNFYVTFTLKQDKRDLAKQDKRDLAVVKTSLTKMLKRYDIPYILIPEYHKDGNIHFHGFITINDFSLIDYKIIDGNFIRDKYGNDVYVLNPIEFSYGFTQLIYLDGKPDYEINKIVNYIVKYLTKDNNRVMSSRYGSFNAYTLALEWFSCPVFKIV